jgi:hypothetical protein
LGLVVFAVLLFAVFSEVMLRLAFFHSKDFSMEMWKYAVQLKHSVAIPQLSFAHVPNRGAFLMGVDVKINSQRLRDYEYPLAKSPDTYRVMMLRNHGPESTLRFTPQDDHPNAKANKLIAEQLRGWIVNNLIRSDSGSQKQLTS